MDLYYYQRDAVDALYAYCQREPEGHPLIVIPTGGGKSYIIATLLQEILQHDSYQRIPMIAHRKELLEQNAGELLELWPQAPVGIYSAGLGKKQLGYNITVGGIQSIYKQGSVLGWSDLIVIDEAHLIPKDGLGQYQTFINDQRNINPNVRIVGFTATPYRLDSGVLTEGKNRLFTDIAYEVSIKELIDGGFLCRPITKPRRDIQPDLTGVPLSGKDYQQQALEIAMTDEDLVARAVADIVRHGNEHNRHSWILFCAGIKHVNMVEEELLRHGIPTTSVTGKTPKLERAMRIEMFKNRQYRAMVNCDVLTTGFNAKNIDLLAMLRPTKSPVLYVQMIGRGTRLYPGKENCLVLDYANNIDEHGPIDEIVVRKKYNKATGEVTETLEKDTAIKECPMCETSVHVRARECPICAYQFPEESFPHSDTASNSAIMSDEVIPDPPVWEDVDFVEYRQHTRRITKEKPEPGIDTLKVTYYTRDNEVHTHTIHHEWVCVDHPYNPGTSEGFARDKAIIWLKTRLACDFNQIEEVAKTISMEEILNDPSILMSPRRILIQKNGRFTEIKDCEL